MLTRRAYYLLKPLLPRLARLAARQIRAKRIRKRCGNIWPILEPAGVKPAGWPGWPDGKQFAFVLTHDVEGPVGLARVRQVAELEMAQGFRSCFNFIPEGSYAAGADVRDWLQANGFEIGVHDLHHDGKLFSSREGFRRKAAKINEYLERWGAVGFRAGFMHHNLDWIHDLDIQYDASTFDTDPFEPQPDGAATIFPFWVGNGVSDGMSQKESPNQRRRSGYVELPYTLVQDYNLFVVLREKTIDIWRRKADWIASREGMVHLDTHPDYTSFERPSTHEFSVDRYAEFLSYIASKHKGKYWHALPRDVAAFVLREQSSNCAAVAKA